MNYRRFEIGQHFFRWNAQSQNSGSGKPEITRLISLRSVTEIMRITIDFDREPGIAAIEIQNVRTARMLAAEFQAKRALAQFAPKQALWQAQFAAQLPCLINLA